MPIAKRETTQVAVVNCVVVPEKRFKSQDLSREIGRAGWYTLQETQGGWVKTLQNRNGFHAAETAAPRCV